MTLVRKTFLGALGLLGAGGVGLAISLEQSVKASGGKLHAPTMQWPHTGFFDSFDHASLRRGYEVYKNVCAACHSMKFMHYRKLINVTHTEAEAKTEAASVEIEDGPDDTGAMFLRPGKLQDQFPSPYKNEEAARYANNGLIPPDLSLMALAREGGEDYIFALLTGYCDPPAGVEIREGLYYNPYFQGGSIGMAKSLYNEAMEFSDGTPATASQMAKDVSAFITFTSEIHHDTRKRLAIKAVLFFAFAVPMVFAWNRRVWSYLRTRQIKFYKPKF